jgi:hypothetical protein
LIGAPDGFHGPGFLLPTRNGELLRWCLGNGLRQEPALRATLLGFFGSRRETRVCVGKSHGKNVAVDNLDQPGAGNAADDVDERGALQRTGWSVLTVDPVFMPRFFGRRSGRGSLRRDGPRLDAG